MHKISGATGENWGLRPYLGKYFWETMGRTVLSYGCLGWLPAIQRVTVRQKLRRVQRMGFKRMCHFRRGTPNRGLELLFGVPPMEMHVVKTALKAYFRTEGLAPHTKETMETDVPSHKGHRQVIREVVEEQALEHLLAPMDQIVPKRLWVREFKIDTESMIAGRAGYGIPNLAEPGIFAWTDGSKKTDDFTGVGVAFTRGNDFVRTRGGFPLVSSYKLMTTNSVYQSEMWAIRKAAQTMIEELENETDNNSGWITKGEPVTIYSDSQASLKALNAVQIKSKLTMETIETLNNLSIALETQVVLRWVKGHAGHLGNETADEAASKAKENTASEPDSPDPPKAIMHTEVDAVCNQLWRQLWDNTLGHRQTRYWFPDGPDPKFAFDIIRLPKLICSQVIAWVTGHCYLNRHQALIDNANTELIRRHVGNTDRHGGLLIPPADPSCSMCPQDDPDRNKMEETPLHLMTECKGLWRLRLDTFGTEYPEPPFRFPVYKIVSFLKGAKIPSFPMQPSLEELYPSAPTAPEPTLGTPPPYPSPPRPPHLPSSSSSRPPSHTSLLSSSTSPSSTLPSSLPLPPPPPPQPQPANTGNDQPNQFPQGDRWTHTFLYLSNPPLKPHKEKELQKRLHSKPLRY